MSYTNLHNDQFIQSRIGNTKGVTCGQNGGGYGSTISSLQKSDQFGLGNTYPVVDKHYDNCQKGGAHDYDADFGGVSYGFTKSGAQYASALKGSYAPITKLKSSNMCGGKKKKRKTNKKKKKKKTLKSKSRSRSRSKSRSKSRSRSRSKSRSKTISNVRMNKGKRNLFATPGRISRSRSRSRSRGAGQPKYSPLARKAFKQLNMVYRTQPLTQYGVAVAGVGPHPTKKATTKKSPLGKAQKTRPSRKPRPPPTPVMSEHLLPFNASVGGRRKRRTKRRRKRTRRRTRRKHRGGSYSQYASNEAHSAGYSTPNTFGSQPWATGPVSKVRYVNSYDNYNHYKH